MNEMHWAHGVLRVAVLTGAGISTDSGIPDYRGPDGVWTRDPSAAAVFRYDNFRRDAATRERFWRTYADHPAWTAEPNAAHRALAAVERAGVGLRIITQNIDGLHQRAGSSPRKVLELHGSMHQVMCLVCGERTPTAGTRDRVLAGEAEPTCLTCGGTLKLATVMFGEHLDPDVLSKAAEVAGAAQLLVAIGSSLQVQPAASLCAVAVDAGARLVVVNRDPTPYDDLAIEVIREPIGAAVPAIARALGAAT
jgi:NAD-dependent deacetylase